MDSSTTEEAEHPPRSDGCSRFEDLPDEILEKIASYFEVETLAAFASTNRRMERISRARLPFNKISIRRTTHKLFEFLDANGSLLRRLDLSNIRASSLEVESIVRKCPNVRELNLINSGFCSLDALLHLANLETLYMSALEDPKQEVLNYREAFHSIKNLYLEIGPRYRTLFFATTLLNFCEVIEFVHLHLAGFLCNAYIYQGVPIEAARWKTLRTVICTHHLSKSHHTRNLLRDVFRHNHTPGIEDWIEEDKDCYIYENGLLNGSFARYTEAAEYTKYLPEVHEAWLTEDDNADTYLTSIYGTPRSVRIKGVRGMPQELVGCPATTLTELDIIGCHETFENKFRLSLLALLPSLESFACTLCFIIHSSARDPAATEASQQQQIFNEALQRLNLKKIRVDGLPRCEASWSPDCSCSLTPAWRCATCKSGTISTSHNLVDMSCFGNLQQITLNGVDLHASAWSKLINSKVQTVRLCLNEKNDFSGLRYFLQRCVNLRHLKFEAKDVLVSNQSVWRDLLEAHNLKRLCLRLRHIRRADPRSSEEIFDCLVRLLEKVDFMHLHCYNEMLLKQLRERLREKFEEEGLKSCFCTAHESFNIRTIFYTYQETRLPDQALCYPAGFAGVVPPPGWTIGE